MQNLIFSLNATIPVFFVMAAGYLLRRIGILNGGFVETLDKFNFRVTLPILLITDLGRADFYQVWDTRFVLYCFFVTLASIAAAALLSLPALKNRSERESSYRLLSGEARRYWGSLLFRIFMEMRGWHR